MIVLGGATFFNQLSIVSVALISNLVLFHYGSLSIYGPDIPISVFSIQTKVITIIFSFVVGIVLGGQPIFGYNYGAQRIDRVRQAYKIVLISALTVGVIATLIFQLCPQIIINLFGGGNEMYLEFAVKTFRIFLSLISVTCLVKITAIFFQSIGKPGSAVLTSLIRDVVCFIPLSIGLPYLLEKHNPGSGINGILYAAPISDAIAAVVILVLTCRFWHRADNDLKLIAKDKNNQKSE